MPRTAVGLTKLMTQASGESVRASRAMASARGASRSALKMPPGPMVSELHIRMPWRAAICVSNPR